MRQTVIRKAVIDDAKSIAKIHAYSWTETYKGLIPDAILEDKLNTIDNRSLIFAKRIKEYNDLYVCVVDDEVAGMMQVGKSLNENYPDVGEIYAIYLLKNYQGKGIGKQLFLYALEELISLGYKDMLLNVLEGNKTISFYEKYDGKIIGLRFDSIGDFILNEKIMYFNNIVKIVDRHR